jgi:hypothetical protein
MKIYMKSDREPPLSSLQVQIYDDTFNYIQQKINFNIFLSAKAILQRCIMRIS